jgi:hypothetical protein
VAGESPDKVEREESSGETTDEGGAYAGVFAHEAEERVRQVRQGHRVGRGSRILNGILNRASVGILIILIRVLNSREQQGR